MNATRFFSRAFVAIVSLFLIAGLAMGQNLNLNAAGGTLAGVWNVKGNVNTGSASAVYTFSGTVNLNGTGTTLTQTVGAAGAAKALVFTDLNATGDKIKALAGTVTINGAFVQNNTGTQAFTVGANTIEFFGSTTVTSGSFVATNGSSVVNYKSVGANQTILASTYGGTLGLSGAAVKHIGTGGVDVSGTITHTASSGKLVVDNALSVSGGATTLDVVDVSNTLTYSGSNTMTITSIGTHSGTITTGAGSGTIAFAQTGALTNGGTITTATGTLTFAGNVVNSASKFLTVTGAGTAKFAGSVDNTAGGVTFTFAANSTAEYNGTSGQTIAGPSAGGYSKLTLTGNNVKTAYGSFGGLNTLTINGTTTLDMAGNTIGSVSTYAVNQTGTDSTTWATVKFSGASNGQAIAQGIVEYYGTGGQTIGAGSYRLLKLTGSGNKDVADGATVTTSSSLVVNSGADLRVGLTAGATLNVNATLDLNGTFANFTGSNANILGDFNVNGAVTNNGTVTVGN